MSLYDPIKKGKEEKDKEESGICVMVTEESAGTSMNGYQAGRLRQETLHRRLGYAKKA
jgi:hypothetical protein